ncbi:MAG: DUF599 domain-containing protein [Chromatiaceae bacterium]|jgi:uncharacterized membrane protein|nr:DUF599 domain-containing protein [Chromatiaceae bacterium]
MSYENAVQVLVIVLGFAILVGYHLRLYIRLHRRPETTSIGLANHMRSLWVENMMKEGRKDVLPVQTLRNLTMAASFLASTAIIVGLGILNLAVTSETTPEAPKLLMLFGFNNHTLWTIKLMLLWAVFLFCFYNFMMAVRYYNHTALLINVPPDQHIADALHRPGYLIRLPPITGAAPGVRMVADVLNQGAAHYTLGMRGYYLVIPMALWLVGAFWFFLGALGLTLVLRRIDSAG